jgi:hypothetical protein
MLPNYYDLTRLSEQRRAEWERRIQEQVVRRESVISEKKKKKKEDEIPPPSVQCLSCTTLMNAP